MTATESRGYFATDKYEDVVFVWEGQRWTCDDLVRLFEKASATSPGLIYRQTPSHQEDEGVSEARETQV